MNIHQLRCFSAVAKTRSLSDGALRERISEATLSRQIKNLERELGAQLVRVGRRIQLTDSGKSLFAVVTSILNQLPEVEAGTPAQEAVQERLVVVGAPPSIAPYILPFAVADFQKNYPGIRVNIVEESPLRLLESLKNEEMDISFAQLPVAEKGISSEELIREPLYAIVSESHRLASRKTIDLKELQDEPFILTKHELSLRGAVVKVLKRSNVQPDVLLEALSLSTIFAMVSSGLGVSLIPQMAMRKQKGCRFLRLQNSWGNRTVGLLRLKNREFGATKLLFIESLKRSVQGRPSSEM